MRYFKLHHHVKYISHGIDNALQFFAFLLTLFIFIIGIFYPSGEPISPHLLRCSAFAVEDHSFMRCALHLRQPRLVNNPGLNLMTCFLIY